MISISTTQPSESSYLQQAAWTAGKRVFRDGSSYLMDKHLGLPGIANPFMEKAASTLKPFASNNVRYDELFNIDRYQQYVGKDHYLRRIVSISVPPKDALYGQMTLKLTFPISN